jgi:hypothetical protein
MPVLLAGRGISGVGGAGITTVSRIIISDVRSLDENSVQASVMVSLQGLGYIIGEGEKFDEHVTNVSLRRSLGPLVGGGLTSISWRYIFAINIPVATFSILLLWALLRHGLVGPRTSLQTERESTAQINQLSSEGSELTVTQKLARVDWLGAFILITASILVLFGLSAGSTSPNTSNWTAPSVLGSLISGGIVTVAFPACEWLLRANATYEVRRSAPSIWRKLRVKWATYTKGVEPMIPLALFKSSDVWISYFNALTGGMLLFSCLYFLSTYFVVVVGYSPVRSTLQLLLIAPGLGTCRKQSLMPFSNPWLGIGSYVGIFMIKKYRQASAFHTKAIPLAEAAFSAEIPNHSWLCYSPTRLRAAQLCHQR